MKKLIVLAAVVLVAAMALTGCKSTPAANKDNKSTFPTKPITLVTWSSPGAGGDLTVRAIQKGLDGILPVATTVENKSGGSGAVGMQYVASKPADGYTVLLATKNLVLTPHTGGTAIDYKAFEAVARLEREPFFIAVKADSSYKTLTDLVNAAKAKTLSMGGAFAGSTDAMTAQKFMEAAGVKFTYVPFEGGGDTITALLGGHIDAQIGAPSELTPQVEAGAVRILAACSEERYDAFPDVPTTSEQGVNMGTSENWRGFVVPKGTPADVIKTLQDYFQKASQSQAYKDYQKNNGMSDAWMDSAEFATSIAEQDAEIVEYLKANPVQ
jgi:tripartite-type tricarboxylate transporter receptor subunit TctC